MKKEKKEDLRVRKTKLNLYNGLLKLMETVPFENIKVTDICNESLVNRSTFYDHFNDKYELFNSYINYLGESFDDKMRVKINSSSINSYYIEYLKLLIEEIESKKKVYRTIFVNNYNSIAKNMIIDSSVRLIVSHINSEYKIDDKFALEYGTLFYVTGTVSILSKMLEKNENYDPNYLIEFYTKLVPEFKTKKEN